MKKKEKKKLHRESVFPDVAFLWKIRACDGLGWGGDFALMNFIFILFFMENISRGYMTLIIREKSFYTSYTTRRK